MLGSFPGRCPPFQLGKPSANSLEFPFLRNPSGVRMPDRRIHIFADRLQSAKRLQTSERSCVFLPLTWPSCSTSKNLLFRRFARPFQWLLALHYVPVETGTMSL